MSLASSTPTAVAAGPAEPATGLLSRAALLERLDHELEVARRGHGSVALVVLRVAHLDEIGQALGRQAADAIRRAGAHRIRATLRPFDFAGHADADTFAVVLPGLHVPRAAETIARRMAALVAQPFVFGGRRVHAGATGAAATHPATPGNAEALLEAALAALPAPPARAG